MCASSPWYNAECKSMKTKTRRLERIYRSDKTEISRNRWQEQFELQRVSFQRIYTDYWSSVIRDSPDSKSLWRRLNCVLHPSDTLTCPHSAQAFARFFDDKIEAIRLNTAGAAPPVINSRAVPTFDTLKQCSVEEVAGFIQVSANKQCQLDPVPTRIVKQCCDLLSPVITTIINDSFAEGYFPDILKSAVVKPIIRKSNMDRFDLKSWRPISNLSFLSKLVERVATSRLNEHLSQNDLLPAHQSAYRAHHSTETAVTAVVNDIARSIDAGHLCALVLLDLSAAFDTIDHKIFIDIMEKRFAVQDTALGWLNSYLDQRTQFYCVGADISTSIRLKYGVPQGSVAGPCRIHLLHRGTRGNDLRVLCTTSLLRR